jgi:hypothetical protein
VGDSLNERRVSAFLLLAATGIVVFFTVFLPTRVSGWGAVVVHGTRSQTSAMCGEMILRAEGRRGLPIAPNIVMSSDGVFPSAGLRCNDAESAVARITSTRFKYDSWLALVVKLLPVLLFALARSAGRWVFPVSLVPLAWDAVTSKVWTDASFLFPGQHVYVANNVAQHRVYGWTSSEMEAYGFPAAAAASWGVGDTPSASGWTYPAYTLLLAAIYTFIGQASLDFLTRVAIGLNLSLVIIAFALLYACLAKSGKHSVAGTLVFLACLSGWAWALCPFPASEPLQALITAASVWIAARMRAWPSVFWLVGLCAIGHLTKPVVGLIPSAALLAHVVLVRKAELVHPLRYGTIALVIFALPLGLWAMRMYFVFGTFILSSTVGGLFFAQSLDPAMTLPSYFGGSELEYGQASRADISHRLSALAANPAYRHALLQLRASLLFPSLTGLNYVSEAGRMGNSEYTGIGLMLFCLAIACVLLAVRGVAIACGLAIVSTIAILALTQPLGRYFAPLIVLYLVIIGQWIHDGFPHWRGVLPTAGVLAMGLLYAHHIDGWF